MQREKQVIFMEKQGKFLKTKFTFKISPLKSCRQRRPQFFPNVKWQFRKKRSTGEILEKEEVF